MSRPHPNWRGTGYNDERRRSSYDSYNRSYNPTDDHGRDRDHDRDRPPIRRDSRDGRERDVRDQGDFRDSRSGQDSRGPRDTRRDAEPPRPLRLDTVMQDSPRKPSPVNNSPASSRGGKQSSRPTPTELFPDKIVPSSLTLTPTMPITPKAKDPRQQGIVDAVHKFSETCQERQLVKLQMDKHQREAPLRQQEGAKLGGKSAGFPPYLEFEARFKRREEAECAELNDKIKFIDQRYMQDLEHLVSSYSSQTAAKSPKPVTTKDPSVGVLETQFAEFAKRAEEQQKQIVEAQNQIRMLLDMNQKSSEKFTTLQSDFKDLKSDYGGLQAENLRLKLQVDELKAAEMQTNSLVQNTVSAEEFGETKSMLESLAGLVNGQNKLSQELKEKLETIIKEREMSGGTLQTMDSTVKKLETQVDSLDVKTIDEIIESWVDLDLKHKVLTHEEYINSMQYGPKSFDTVIQGIRRKIESLESQHANHSTAAFQSSSGTLPSTRALEMLFQEKLGPVKQSLKQVMEKHMADSENALAGLIDDGDRRIKALEGRVNALARQTPPGQRRGMEAQIASLEGRVQSIVADSLTLNQLVTRIAAIEDKGLGHRVDRIDLALSNLSKDVGKLENGIQEHPDMPGFREVKVELDENKSRVDALEQSIRSLNSQWVNINSKQMAERIIQQLNPFAQTIESRIARTEDLALHLEQRSQELERTVNSRNKELNRVHELLTTLAPGEKRPASSSPRIDEAAKKRKLETNGHNSLPSLRNGNTNQRSAS